MWTVAAIALIVVMVGAVAVIGRRLPGPGEPRAGKHLAASPPKRTRTAPDPAAVGLVPELIVRSGALLRRSPAARRALSVLSALLFVGAAAMVGYPYFSNLYQHRTQSNLGTELASGELEAKYRSRTVGEGDALTRLKIPSLDVEVVVVEGVSDNALRAGAGHYPSTPLPCEVGNVSIAGHRTTFGRPFHNLDLLGNGDTIVLETPIGTCTYEISVEPFVVAPSDTHVIDNTPDEALLTLTTCNPKGSARERLIVHATMTSSETFSIS